ncbi:MAG: hypothetical protein GF408_06990 [Candidatus Omnitrophica bacterium]|nr:hypothetical protein [Candidatus Omnitrophota bacterium]
MRISMVFGIIMALTLAFCPVSQAGSCGGSGGGSDTDTVEEATETIDQQTDEDML